MYYPKFRTKRNNVPILSKDEIDSIAEKYLLDFNPKVLDTPQPIDEDRFLTEYLGLVQDFQYLTNSGIYLGMIVFNDSNKVIVYDQDTRRAEYIKAKAGTVIIDNSLLENGQEHRYRFTVIHEAGHWIFHRAKYSRDLSQVSWFDFGDILNIKCRPSIIDRNIKPVDQWNDNDTMEWQANYFASALLMPKSMVLKVCNDKEIKDYLTFMSFGNIDVYNELLIKRISYIFNVSKKAAKVRLCNLNIINTESNTNSMLSYNKKLLNNSIL
ncbi:MAG TPA: hypothetical protein DG753_06620 [Clostridium sp.]|nr:hypothetical protein [Clostridium sp.]